MSMESEAENIEAVVKLETLVNVLSWIPTGSPAVAIWLNCWLGPHWILVPDGIDVLIQRHGMVVYKGPLNGFVNCQKVMEHRVGMKMCDDETQTLIYGLAFELEDLLRRASGPLESFELQGAVQGFFRQRRR